MDGKEAICERVIKEGNIVFMCKKTNKDKIKDINLIINDKLVLLLTILEKIYSNVYLIPTCVNLLLDMIQK